ncbi:hypothetical protein TOT_040000013 [Theileria orientalis strain Shintoku]|uniref:Uncharacterized protein n=1 Tax=Theileria orientalis strain Shintoku TaxID=869250 RepID=J4CDS1_THEOR|nr:hypothetical protein TOT_040000013 [Theileria orientalis strain Shintoku]BAM41632.1 hypothetical protein TOT_040000013 [Theileria orientalis strain Shintoku]|eukprot:XP_009691933.1 hypothetical protein TOT_040000013 [Theileria orientalis strain Shintoku]
MATYGGTTTGFTKLHISTAVDTHTVSHNHCHHRSANIRAHNTSQP